MGFFAYIITMIGFAFAFLGIVIIALIMEWLSHRYGYHEDCSIYPSERLAALERDGYTCQVCGCYPANVTHHITPRALGGSDRRENLMTVCPRCHPTVETF